MCGRTCERRKRRVRRDVCGIVGTGKRNVWRGGNGKPDVSEKVMGNSSGVIKMRLREDQKGFTFVEVLIAAAILSIVVLTVCAFIVVGSRSYATANSDINVQQEAQLSLNQMSDVLIDTTRSVNYVGYDGSGNIEKALKDAEFTFTPEDKSLVMYNGVVEETPAAIPGGTPTKTVDAGNGNKHYHFYWNKNAETLYYAELDVQPTDVDTTAIHFPTFDPADPAGAGWVVLAKHVTDFSVDLSQVEEKRVVQLALTFLDGRKEYVTSNNVTIRNKVGVNDAELEPLNKKKTLSIMARDKGVILEPGESYHFSTPKVTGENVADRSVTWSLASWGSPSGGTKFTDTTNGILQIATDEPAGTLDVVITTNAVDSDGNHASCSFEVYIKRVTSVSLSKTADSDPDNADDEISPGCTFTISANVAGTRLGETCSGCGDDTTIDKQVVYEGNPLGNPYVWLIHDPSSMPGATTSWNPQKYVEIIESKPDHATFRLKDDAPISDPNNPDHTYTVTIQAMSFLSTQDNSKGRHYDNWVPGGIELKFKKSKKNIGVDGNIRWGVKVGVWADYPSDFNKAGQGYFLIFARVREEGTEGGDKIIAYRTTGWNGEVTPDLFGVEDISKPWYLSLQVLDPGGHLQSGVGPSNELVRDLEQQIHDQRVKDVVADYLANCDSSGTYVGTKYPHTDKFEGCILPPEIYYAYDGQTNLGGELKLKTVTTLAGPDTTAFNVDYVKNTRDERDRNQFTNRSVRFSAYKEDGGTLEKIFWYNAKENNYQGNSQPYNGAIRFDEIQSATNSKIKIDFNRKEMFSQAAGKYRIIPTINYYQDPGADTSYSIYYANYQPNYWNTQSYEVPESTVYYELINGGNLELWSYYNNQFTKGEIYFPTPSDNSFTNYFNRENLDWQSAKRLDNFSKTIKGKNETTTYEPSSMRCRYVADKKVYQLELFYNYNDSKWNRAVEASAGVFQCAADGSRWERKDRGTYDNQLEQNKQPQLGSTADVDFMMWGNRYKGKVYIPLPSESTFTDKSGNALGFEKKGEWQTKDGFNFKYQPEGQQGTQDLYVKLKCYYDAAKDEFTIQIYNSNWDYVAAFTCKSNGKQWTQQ